VESERARSGHLFEVLDGWRTGRQGAFVLRSGYRRQPALRDPSTYGDRIRLRVDPRTPTTRRQWLIETQTARVSYPIADPAFALGPVRTAYYLLVRDP
jgi:hypothetical protein